MFSLSVVSPGRNQTTVRRELLAGLTTLMTMAYVVVVLFSGVLFLLLTLSNIANKSSTVFPIG